MHSSLAEISCGQCHSCSRSVIKERICPSLDHSSAHAAQHVKASVRSHTRSTYWPCHCHIIIYLGHGVASSSSSGSSASQRFLALAFTKLAPFLPISAKNQLALVEKVVVVVANSAK